jgi:hypothetical protein
MPAIKKSFSVKSGLDANANTISNLGVANASLTLSGANAVTLTTTGATNVTLPTSGTLLYSGGALGTPASGNLANCTFPTLNQNTTGSAGSVTNALTISSPLSGTSYNASAAVSIGLATAYGDSQNPYASKTANYFLAAPNGSAGAPTFRAIVAADIPTLNQNTTGSSSSCTGNAATATTAGSITSQANSATITAATANTASTIVLRDASGNFSAGVMTGTATTARYADLAENYVSDQQYDYGIVLMIGGDEEVTIADEDTQRLAGVVSQNPAYLMNSECEGNHVVAIALQGRTPVRVMGKVNKGDFLVSAGDGYAKATDNPKIGSIIGKSLESFDGQYGMVEAMVGRL